MIKVMIKDFDGNVYHLEVTEEQYKMALWFYEHDYSVELERVEFEKV